MKAGSIGVGRSIAGLIAGFGLAVLMQEYSVVYPTATAAIASVGFGGLFGLGLNILGHVAVPD